MSKRLSEEEKARRERIAENLKWARSGYIPNRGHRVDDEEQSRFYKAKWNVDLSRQKGRV